MYFGSFNKDLNGLNKSDKCDCCGRPSMLLEVVEQRGKPAARLCRRCKKLMNMGTNPFLKRK